MNTSAIMDLINELEERFPVDQWTAGGIHIWPYLRIKLNFDLYYTYHTGSGSPQAAPWARIGALLKGLSRFAYASLADAGKNRSARGRADVVLVSDGLSYAFQDALWYEKFCDPLIDRFAAEGISTLLVSPSHTYHIPRRSPSLFIQPRLDAARIRNMVFSSPSPANDALQQAYPAYQASLESRNLQLTVPVLAEVVRYASVLRSMASVYRSLLRRTKPSLVFVVSYYGMEGMAVNLACRELGIPSVDLQHGLQGDLHVAYARWKRVPADGYELLPSRFWVWEESDARTIEQWNAPVARWHRPIVGGNLWLNEWLNGQSSMAAAYDRQMRNVRDQFPGKPHVLVTLQFNLADEQTLGPLLATMQRTQQEWRWWVRLHPVMLNEREAVRMMLTRSGITDVELDLATDLPLYALLRHMDIHLTHSSSTVIEAELFGVPSVVISEYGAEFFSNQLRSGWAVTAFSADDIRAAIARQLEARTVLQQRGTAPSFAPQGFNETLLLARKRPRCSATAQGRQR